MPQLLCYIVQPSITHIGPEFDCLKDVFQRQLVIVPEQYEQENEDGDAATDRPKR